MESFCSQCGNDDIESNSLRHICILLRAIAFIAIALYGATITSFFAVETFRAPFTNMEEFVGNGKYRILLASKDAVTTYETWFLVALSFFTTKLEQ